MHVLELGAAAMSCYRLLLLWAAGQRGAFGAIQEHKQQLWMHHLRSILFHLLLENLICQVVLPAYINQH